jgi:hypothetical protein
MANPSQFAQSYNSFSGVDIKAVFNKTVLAELQAISYSVTREKAPLYTMGSADPRSFSRGKRGIAGTLIFLVFDRHALLGTFGIYASDPIKFMSDKDDAHPDAAGAIAPVAIAQATNVLNAGNQVQAAESSLTTNIDEDQEAMAPWFSDQIPPFDITLAAANEYGSFAVMRIFGVEILNEGYGVSIDDIVSEQQMTYVARTLVGWRPVASSKSAEVGFGGPQSPTV